MPLSRTLSNDLCSSIYEQSQANPSDLILDGRYRLLDTLGKGSVGAVYRAEHLWMNKTVAIKLLRPEVTSSEEAVKRFAREARLASLMDNAHCVNVYDFAQAPDGTYYLAMEYLEGQTLYKAIRKEKRLSLDQCREIFLPILEALAAAHAIGIVHRDMKPENIMLLNRGGPYPFIKILDFGIAKGDPGGDGAQLTRVGFTVGTPEYMSPEQATAVEIDGRADLYSTGVMLFECATGRRPFLGSSAVEIASAHVGTIPPKPREVCPEAGISAELEAIILKALEKEPSNRFPSAESFAKALAKAIPDPKLEREAKPAVKPAEPKLEPKPTPSAPAASSQPPASATLPWAVAGGMSLVSLVLLILLLSK
jgi:eukaryotic-like serine/threonine-protein kinase